MKRRKNGFLHLLVRETVFFQEWMKWNFRIFLKKPQANFQEKPQANLQKNPKKKLQIKLKKGAPVSGR